MSCAVFALTLVSSAFGRTVSASLMQSADGMPVGLSVSFGEAQDGEVNSLFLAYGNADGGSATNGWEKVRRVNFVSSDGVTGSVVVEPEMMSCVVPFPDDFDGAPYARLFLFAGETGVPYETRYDSMTSPRGGKTSAAPWIDTEIVPTTETAIDITFTVENDGMPPFGVANNFYCFGTAANQSYYGMLRWNSTAVSCNCFNGKFRVRLSKEGAYVDDHLLGVPEPQEERCTGSIALFGRIIDAATETSVSSSDHRSCKCTIWSATIYEAGVPVRNFVSVNKGGINGLFDCLSGRFFAPYLHPNHTLNAGTLVSTVVAASEQVAVSECVSTDSVGISFESVTVEDRSVTFGWMAGAAGDVAVVLTERDTQTTTTNLLQTAAEKGAGSASLTLPYNVPYSARLLLTVGNEVAESADRSFDMPLGDIRNVRAWRSTITFPGFTAAETLTDFPALVKLAKGHPLGFDPADCAADGADLLFTDTDGNILSHEVDTWDPEGTSFVWVSVPELSAGTSVFLYWKDVGQRVEVANDPTRVWADYIGVWHLNEQSGTAVDATGHGLVGTPKGTRASDSVGVAGGAIGVARRNVNTSAGKGSRIEVPSYSAFGGATQFTVSGFFKRNGTWQGERGQYPRILARQENAVYDGWAINLADKACGYSVRGAAYSPAASVPGDVGPTLEAWSHLTIVYDGPSCSFYGDGVKLLDNVPISSAADNKKVLAFGSLNDGRDNSFDGWMDEIRLYNGVMSTARATAEYATMGENDAFTSYGAAESCSDNGVISVSSVVAYERAATVGGLVLDAEGGPVAGATVIVSYGPDAEHLEPQAGSVTTAADGSFSVILAPLKPQTTYAYRLEASGPVSCGTVVLSLTTAFVARHSRLKKCELAFPGYAVALALNDFPVLVRLNEGHPAGFSYADCAEGGGDLLATDAANNPLDLEIETWDPSGESLVWVRVPKFTVDSRVRLYWHLRDDAPELEPFDSTGVWRGYTGVWHLDESEGTAVDATGHGLDGVPSGAAAAQMVVTNDAILGGARVNVYAKNYQGSYLLVSSADALNQGSHFTASGFFKMTRDTWPGLSGIYPRLFSRSGQVSAGLWSFNLAGAAAAYTVRGEGATPSTIENGPMLTNTWTHLALVYDGTEALLYADGVLVGATPVTAPANGDQTLAIGCANNGSGDSFGGLLDEIRLAPGSATPQRVKAEYDTMMNNAAFTAYGATEPSSGAGLVFDRLEAVASAGGVAIEGTVICDDDPAAGVTVSLSLGTDPAALSPYAGTATTDEKGELRIVVGGLEPDTTYFYQTTAARDAASLTAAVRRFTALGASSIIETAFAVQNHTLVCSGAVRLGAGETTVVLLVGESPDAVTREVTLKTFAAGSTGGSFSEEFNMEGLPASFYKIICRNTSGASSWSDETQAVAQQFPSDQPNATYVWNGNATGVWNDDANWTTTTGQNGWPYTAASAASFPAAGGAIEVTSVPNAFVRELSIASGGRIDLNVDANATLAVTSDPLATNGTLTVTDTDLHLTGGRLACEAITLNRTTTAAPCSITVSDGGELWLGGSSVALTAATRAELHVIGTGMVQLGRPNDGNALWEMGTDSKMFLGSEHSEVRKAFGVARALLEVTNGVHGGTIKFLNNAVDNVVRVSGPTAAVTGALRMFDSTTTRNNLVLVEKGALLAPVDDFRDVRGTSNVVRIVDAMMRCESFGTDANNPFGGVSDRGWNSGIEFCGTTPKLTVEGAWISGNSSGAPVKNAAHLIFSVSGAGYAAEPIEVAGLATVNSNTVFEVRVAKDSTQGRIPLMKVASTPWAAQGDLKAVVDGLNAVAVLPEGARLVVSKDGKSLYCKRQTGLLLFVR